MSMNVCLFKLLLLTVIVHVYYYTEKKIKFSVRLCGFFIDFWFCGPNYVNLIFLLISKVIVLSVAWNSSAFTLKL